MAIHLAGDYTLRVVSEGKSLNCLRSPLINTGHLLNM